MKNRARRLGALIAKEFRQLLRDPSSFLIGIAIPMMLILLIGNGLSLDVKRLPVAVALEDASPTAQDMLSFLNGSEYFAPHYVTSMHEAVDLMDTRQADAIIRIPPNFTETLRRGGAAIQVVVYGVDTVTAAAAGKYIQSGISQRQAAYQAAHPELSSKPASVRVVDRQWFNDANTSTWMFIPGLIVIVMPLVGVFLTALVMAREWERGTLESLFATPVQPLEIILAKILPYFCVAMAGFLLCMVSARYIYDVPIHGSILIILLASVEYVLVAAGMGLTISSIVKNQFLACQIALVVGLLPTVMLSGFIFDLRSVPAVISVIGHILPATYYMELLKTLFLSGNNWFMIARNCAVLAAYGAAFIMISLRVTKKRLP